MAAAEELAASTCAKCGRPIVLRRVASDAFTNEPVYRWCADNSVPITCSVTDKETGGRHMPSAARVTAEIDFSEPPTFTYESEAHDA